VLVALEVLVVRPPSAVGLVLLAAAVVKAANPTRTLVAAVQVALHLPAP